MTNKTIENNASFKATLKQHIKQLIISHIHCIRYYKKYRDELKYLKKCKLYANSVLLYVREQSIHKFQYFYGSLETNPCVIPRDDYVYFTDFVGNSVHKAKIVLSLNDTQKSLRDTQKSLRNLSMFLTNTIFYLVLYLIIISLFGNPMFLLVYSQVFT